MDFKEKSEHYFRIAFAMKEAGKSDDQIETYLKKEEMDHNEIFLIMDRLDTTDKLPDPESVSSGGGGLGKKILGVPLKIVGCVLGVLGLGLIVMKLFAGGGFDRGYVVAIASIVVGVVFFLQGRGK